jgi:hypothetical protein
MYVIRARNVNDAYPQGAQLLQDHGVPMASRYGDTLEVRGPVATIYERPRERVLFDCVRDANPFFHFFEALWILAGRQDVAFLTQFASRMGEFSDNGDTFHAAYGHRLRHWPAEYPKVSLYAEGLDQLEDAISMLRNDPTDRRVVLSIWDPARDLATRSKDIPCNDTLKFEARHGALDLTLFNRSNDLIWGTYGANPVQFSYIQEYVAGMAGLPVGQFWQVSGNYHVYRELYAKKCGDIHSSYLDFYQGELDSTGTEVLVAPYGPLVGDPKTFDRDLALWMGVFDRTTDDMHALTRDTRANPFFTDVAWPLYFAHRAYKAGDHYLALDHAAACKAQDWALAATQWLNRRQEKRNA